MFWRLAQHKHRKVEILAQFAAVKSVCWQRGSCVGDKSSFCKLFLVCKTIKLRNTLQKILRNSQAKQ